MLLRSLLRLPLGWLLLLVSLPFFGVAIWNHGFLASDEYWTGMTRYLPAQTSALSRLVDDTDVKSPMQLAPMHAVAQLALAMGMDRAFDQYRLVIFVLGAISTILLLWAFTAFDEDETDRRLGLVFLGAYFAAPLIFTRPMFESLSAPFVAWTAVLAYRYDARGRRADFLWGVVAATLAFVLRPQTGIVAIVFPWLAISRRRWRDLIEICAWGAFLFVVTGLPDLWLRGSFHRSVFDLIKYNWQHGSEYGSQPWYYYFPLLLIVFYAPWMFARGSGRRLRQAMAPRRSWIFMLAVFIAVHSLFSNKFERFLIPIIPLVILLMVPMLRPFLEEAGRRRWRLGSLALLNGVLWCCAVFFQPQGAIIELAKYFDAHPEIRKVVNLDQAITWIPDLFIAAEPPSMEEMSSEQFAAKPPSCERWVIARRSGETEARLRGLGFESKVVFASGPVEWLAYQLNPSHNQRRASLALFACASGTAPAVARHAVSF